MPRPFPKKISQIKPVLSNVALSSHFAVEFGGFGVGLKEYLRLRGIDPRFITDNISLLCCRASLPGSGFATTDVVGNFMGVTEKMAHTRTFVQMDLDFYVDTGYRSLKFIEHWVEIMSSRSTTFDGVSALRDGYYFRMRYPDEYKCDETRIIKFEKDYKRYIEYRFFGLFPLSLNAVPVSYEGSTILKATASFHYDRYVSGQSRSLNEFFRNDNNKTLETTAGELANNPLNNAASNVIYGNAGANKGTSYRNARVNTNNDLGINVSGDYFGKDSSILSDREIASGFIGNRFIN